MNEKRVLHIIDSFGMGGAETWLLATVKYLQEHPELNLHFDFVATGNKKGVLDEDIINAGSTIYYVKYSYGNIPQFRKELGSILKSNHYYAVHDHQDFISGWHFFFLSAALPNLRITHLHNPYAFVRNYIVNPFRWVSFHMGRLLTITCTSKITGTSNAVMDEYGYNKWPYNKKRVKPVYCGFDINRFKYLSDAKDHLCKEFGWDFRKTKIALFVGRIDIPDSKVKVTQKNPDFAFLMAKDLIVNDDSWKFIFVGHKGNLGLKMENEIHQRGLSDSIKFLGVRNDISMIMSASDVFVFPSLNEGLGMVAVEAQSSGLPVLMSDNVPSEAIICKELVTIKSLSDGYRSWNETLKEISTIDFNRAEYADKAQVSPFSIENSVHGLVDLYGN